MQRRDSLKNTILTMTAVSTTNSIYAKTNPPPYRVAFIGRAALEMILAAYESRRQNASATQPLKNRRHPL